MRNKWGPSTTFKNIRILGKTYSESYSTRITRTNWKNRTFLSRSTGTGTFEQDSDRSLFSFRKWLDIISNPQQYIPRSIRPKSNSANNPPGSFQPSPRPGSNSLKAHIMGSHLHHMNAPSRFKSMLKCGIKASLTQASIKSSIKYTRE